MKKKNEKDEIREKQREILMMAMANITPFDQATFAAMQFCNPSEMPPEMASRAVESLMKFAVLGFHAYHLKEFAGKPKQKSRKDAT